MRMGRNTIHIDLHDVWNDETAVEERVDAALARAEHNKRKRLEIVCGKGAGKLKEFVLELLDRRGVPRRHEVREDFAETGTVIVHFDWG